MISTFHVEELQGHPLNHCQTKSVQILIEACNVGLECGKAHTPSFIDFSVPAVMAFWAK